MKKIKLNFNTADKRYGLDYFTNVSKQHKEHDFEIDISSLNIVEAGSTAFLFSTYLFVNNPDAKVRWYIKDNETLKLISLRKLKNMELSVKNNIKCLNLDCEKKVWQIK